MAKIIELIYTEERRGLGTEDDPVSKLSTNHTTMKEYFKWIFTYEKMTPLEELVFHKLITVIIGTSILVYLFN